MKANQLRTTWLGSAVAAAATAVACVEPISIVESAFPWRLKLIVIVNAALASKIITARSVRGVAMKVQKESGESWIV